MPAPLAVAPLLKGAASLIGGTVVRSGAMTAMRGAVGMGARGALRVGQSGLARKAASAAYTATGANRIPLIQKAVGTAQATSHTIQKTLNRLGNTKDVIEKVVDEADRGTQKALMNERKYQAMMQAREVKEQEAREKHEEAHRKGIQKETDKQVNQALGQGDQMAGDIAAMRASMESQPQEQEGFFTKIFKGLMGLGLVMKTVLPRLLGQMITKHFRPIIDTFKRFFTPIKEILVKAKDVIMGVWNALARSSIGKALGLAAVGHAGQAEAEDVAGQANGGNIWQRLLNAGKSVAGMTPLGMAFNGIRGAFGGNTDRSANTSPVPAGNPLSRNSEPPAIPRPTNTPSRPIEVRRGSGGTFMPTFSQGEFKTTSGHNISGHDMASTSSIGVNLAALMSRESGNNYNAANNRLFDTRNTVVNRSNKYNFRDMTLRQVWELMGRPGRDGRPTTNRDLFAVGRYQIIPKTFMWAMEQGGEFGYDWDSKFDEATQDAMFQAIVKYKRPKLYAYLSGQSDDLRAAQIQAAQEWAAFAMPAGTRTASGRTSDGTSTYYDRDGGNKASVSADTLGELLRRDRAMHIQSHNQDVRTAITLPTPVAPIITGNTAPTPSLPASQPILPSTNTNPVDGFSMAAKRQMDSERAAPMWVMKPDENGEVLGELQTTTDQGLHPRNAAMELLRAFPGARISSTYRDPATNDKARGMPNSQHLRGTAFDVVVDYGNKAQTYAQIQAWASARGFQVVDELNRAGYPPHFHIQVPRGARVDPRGVFRTREHEQAHMRRDRNRRPVESASSSQVGQAVHAQGASTRGGAGGLFSGVRGGVSAAPAATPRTGTVSSVDASISSRMMVPESNSGEMLQTANHQAQRANQQWQAPMLAPRPQKQAQRNPVLPNNPVPGQATSPAIFRSTDPIVRLAALNDLSRSR